MFEPKRVALLAALAAVVVWGAVPASVSPASAGPVIMPHRAVYDLSLAKAAGAGAITQAKGKLEFEWADACANWTVSQRTRVQLVASSGQVVEFGWSLNALEAKDGSAYRFFIRRLNVGEAPEEVRGEATLNGPGKGGLATYEEPDKREVTLPKGTLFPSAHSLVLLEAAERGTFPVGRVVFDGSGDQGIFFVNAVMSRELAPDVQLPLDSPLLRGQKSWRVNLAFFSLDESVAEPEHEQALRMYANGVVDDLILDYGDFSLRASLKALEALPPAGC
jgi:hypothetical protein